MKLVIVLVKSVQEQNTGADVSVMLTQIFNSLKPTPKLSLGNVKLKGVTDQFTLKRQFIARIFIVDNTARSLFSRDASTKMGYIQ